MDLVSIIQYVFCLLMQCSSDGELNNETSMAPTTSQPSSTVVHHVLTTNASDDRLMDNEIGSRYRYRHIRSDTGPIVQEAMRRPGAELLDRTRADDVPCQFNRDCVSGCCLQNSTLELDEYVTRRCSPLVPRGDPCSIGQLKGGLYAIYCPCSAGNGACITVTNGKTRLATRGHGHVCNE